MERRPVTTEYGARVTTELGYVYWTTREAAEHMVHDYKGQFELVSREVTEPRLVVDS